MSTTSAVNSASDSALNSALDATTAPNETYNYSQILAASTGESVPGIDVTAAVDAAIYADRAPERVWQGEITNLSSQTTAMTAIQNATTTVNNDLETLNSLTGPLSARTVTSSNSNYVSATAASGTAAGTYSVVVNNLAATATWYSDQESSATSTLPASSFTITNASGTSTTVNTGSGTSGDTLNDLASDINGLNLGITASVVTDSTGSELSLISNTAASAGNFTITSANYTGTSWTSPTIATGDTLGANTITITPQGGSTQTVTTTSGETYAQLASDINAMNFGVTATAGSNVNGTNISITSATPFTISEPSFGFSQASAGQDANVTVNGVPYTSTTNTITGAISGVTIDALAATGGQAVTLTVASDASGAATAINQLVTDYNTLMGLINTQYTVTTDSNGDVSQGVLASDPTLGNLQTALEEAINYNTSSSSTPTTVSNLSDLGISMNDDGTLTVDTTTLDSALATNPSDVQNFLEGSALNGFANSFSTTLNSYLDPDTGASTLDLNSISSTSSDLTQQIDTFESGYIANQQTILTADYSEAETALQQLPEEMEQLNSELGLTPTQSNS
jgi:flagellar hook-associated protein 2